MGKPSQQLTQNMIINLQRPITEIIKYCEAKRQSIPYQFKPMDPRHAKMYFRACDDNAYIPTLIFIYKYGSDESDWSPVMVYYNPRINDTLWLHGITRMNRNNPNSPEYMYSLYRGLHVSEPNFEGIVGYCERACIDFIELARQNGNKEHLEDTVLALILGRLAQAETWLNHGEAKRFNEHQLIGPKMPFHPYTFDIVSYPATIFLKKYTQLLIRCAKENYPITHQFRILPWMNV